MCPHHCGCHCCCCCCYCHCCQALAALGPRLTSLRLSDPEIITKNNNVAKALTGMYFIPGAAWPDHKASGTNWQGAGMGQQVFITSSWWYHRVDIQRLSITMCSVHILPCIVAVAVGAVLQWPQGTILVGCGPPAWQCTAHYVTTHESARHLQTPHNGTLPDAPLMMGEPLGSNCTTGAPISCGSSQCLSGLCLYIDRF